MGGIQPVCFWGRAGRDWTFGSRPGWAGCGRAATRYGADRADASVWTDIWARRLLYLGRDKNWLVFVAIQMAEDQVMKDWKRYEKGLHHVGPHWIRFFGDGLVGNVFEEPNAEGRFAWYVADSRQPGVKAFRQGLASSIDEAKLSADAAVLDRKRGRVAAVEGELTTSTDRNRGRVDRLLASESLARGLIEDLATYHQELVATGDVETADRIALSLRRAALGGFLTICGARRVSMCGRDQEWHRPKKCERTR
jgi:hypothetical protein